MIFDWFVNERVSPRKIARRLTMMGVPTQTGKQEWNRGTIIDILKNNIYIGEVRWNKRKVLKEYKDGKISKKARRTDPETHLIAQGKHDPLVSKEIFDKAQEFFEYSAPLKFDTTMVNPFCNLMFCKQCGKGMKYMGYNKRPGVSPRIVHSESVFCSVKSSKYDDVLNAVIQGLKIQIRNFEFIIAGDENKKISEQHQKTIEFLKNELRTQEVKRLQLFEYFESGIYTKDEFVERKAVLSDRIEKLKNSIDEQERQSLTIVNYNNSICQFNEVIDALSSAEISVNRKNDLLKKIIKKIEYDCEDFGQGKGGKVILDIHFKDEYKI